MKIRTGYLLAVISILLVSCNVPRYMYSPSVQNVPVLVKKGDSKVSANYSTDLSGTPLTNSSSENDNGNRNNGFDIQGALAVTNNFAIQANYFNRREKDNSSAISINRTTINYKRHLTEIGFGYFKSLKRKGKFILQVFGGVGKGKFSFTQKGIDTGNILYSRYHQANVFKEYIQPALIFHIRRNFSMSVSTRLSIIQFSKIKTDYTDQELGYWLSDLPSVSRVFLEPAFTTTFGFNKLPGVKFEYQMLNSLQVDDHPIDYRAINFSLGVVLDIPKIFKAPIASTKTNG